MPNLRCSSFVVTKKSPAPLHSLQIGLSVTGQKIATSDRRGDRLHHKQAAKATSANLNLGCNCAALAAKGSERPSYLHSCSQSRGFQAEPYHCLFTRAAELQISPEVRKTRTGLKAAISPAHSLCPKEDSILAVRWYSSPALCRLTHTAKASLFPRSNTRFTTSVSALKKGIAGKQQRWYHSELS